MPKDSGEEDSPAPADKPVPTRVIDRRTVPRRDRERVLTIDPRAEVQTQEDLEDVIWHELQNANRTKHILTGKLDSVGRTQNGMDTAIVLYKGIRVLIPLKEMMVHTGRVPSGAEYTDWLDQVTRILYARLDSDIDFVVGGIDEDSRTVVASRREAMRRKRKRFYLDTDELGNHLIEEGRMVQARVVAVATSSSGWRCSAWNAMWRPGAPPGCGRATPGTGILWASSFWSGSEKSTGITW